MKLPSTMIHFFVRTFFSFFISLTFYTTVFCTVDDDIDFARKILAHSTEQKIEHTFFSPSDKATKRVILGLIKNEKNEICTALFRLTDPDIAQALLDAYERGVKITIVTDYGNFYERYQKVTTLNNAGIKTHYYEGFYSIMHHKFYLFKNNFFERPILVTGSANCTKSGLTRNYENIIVTNSLSLINEFQKHFNELLTHTHQGIPTIKQTAKIILRMTMKWMRNNTKYIRLKS